MKAKIKLASLFLLSSGSAFIWPIIKFQEYFIARDWGLFNSFSLFVKSAVFQYGTFPMHQPYTVGGMDFTANPQTRVFSPFIVFDVLFSAPVANLLVMLVLNFIGAIGFYKVLKHLKIQQWVAVLVAIIFSHASWFHLHFAEGHVTFAPFQLFGWVLLCILNFDRPKYQIGYALLSSFFLLEGAFYVFIYAQLFFVFAHLFALEGRTVRRLLKTIYKSWKSILISLVVFAGVAGAKLVPFLLLYGGRAAVLENIQLNPISVFHAFFNPLAHIHLNPPGANYWDSVKFHEVGAYIGLLSFSVVIWYLFKTGTRNFLSYLLLILFFFWTGTGWFDPLNPWRIFQKTPFIANAHIQTRALFIVDFLFYILLAKSLSNIYVQRIKLFYAVTALLLIEAVFVSIYPYKKVYELEDSIAKMDDFPKLICNSTITKTVASSISRGWGYQYEHFNHKNVACYGFMDHGFRDSDIKWEGDPNYKGEAYLLAGSGTVELKNYVPGKIVLNCKLEEPSIIQLNTNFLWGWNTENDSDVFEQDGLVTLTGRPNDMTIVLHYDKRVFYLSLSLLLTGILAAIIAFWVYSQQLIN